MGQTIVMFMSMTTQIVSGISLKSLVDKLLPLMISVQLLLLRREIATLIENVQYCHPVNSIQCDFAITNWVYGLHMHLHPTAVPKSI